MYDYNRPLRKPVPEEVASGAAWGDLYAGNNLDKPDVQRRKELREAIMRGEVLPRIEQVRNWQAQGGVQRGCRGLRSAQPHQCLGGSSSLTHCVVLALQLRALPSFWEQRQKNAANISAAATAASAGAHPLR